MTSPDLKPTGLMTYRGADGATLYARSLGQGPTVILLHGFAMESRHWLSSVWPLRKRYHFVAPDLRGFGRSHDVGLPPGCVLETFAADLEAMLVDMGIARAVLAGISMGALTAVRALATRPAVASRIVAYAHIDQSPKVVNDTGWSFGLFGAGQAERFARFERLLDQVDAISPQTPYAGLPPTFRREIWQAFGDFGAMAMGGALGKWTMGQVFGREWIGRRYLPMRQWSAYMTCMRSYVRRDYDQREAFASMQLPLTLFVGMRSTMYPAEGQLHIATLQPKAQIVRFARSGHSLPYEQPLLFLRAFARMLDHAWRA